MAKFITSQELNDGYFVSEYYDRIPVEELGELLAKAKAYQVEEIECHQITDKKSGQQGIVLTLNGRDVVILQNIPRCPPVC